MKIIPLAQIFQNFSEAHNGIVSLLSIKILDKSFKTCNYISKKN